MILPLACHKLRNDMQLHMHQQHCHMQYDEWHRSKTGLQTVNSKSLQAVFEWHSQASNSICHSAMTTNISCMLNMKCHVRLPGNAILFCQCHPLCNSFNTGDNEEIAGDLHHIGQMGLFPDILHTTTITWIMCTCATEAGSTGSHTGLAYCRVLKHQHEDKEQLSAGYTWLRCHEQPLMPLTAPHATNSPSHHQQPLMTLKSAILN